MNLEFRIYQLKKDSRFYNSLIINGKDLNEFIVVGEKDLGKGFDCFKVQQLYKKGLQLIDGLKIDDTYNILKKDLRLKGNSHDYETVELNIPKEYLTLDIVDNIKRLND